MQQPASNGITFAQLQQMQQQLANQQAVQQHAVQQHTANQPQMHQMVQGHIQQPQVLVQMQSPASTCSATPVQNLSFTNVPPAAVPVQDVNRYWAQNVQTSWGCDCGNVNTAVSAECVRCRRARVVPQQQQQQQGAQRQVYLPVQYVLQQQMTPNSSALSSPMVAPVAPVRSTPPRSNASSSPPSPSAARGATAGGAAVDSAAVSKLLLDREKARRAQDFRKADLIREQLRALEIVWDDDMKTWRSPCGAQGKWGTPTPAAAALGAAQKGFCLRMKGLPYRVKYEDIKGFFAAAQIEILQYSLVLEKNADGRPSGVGHVKVPTQQDQMNAVEKLNHKNMGGFNRYVWVSLSSNEEYNEAASRWTGGGKAASASTSTLPLSSSTNTLRCSVNSVTDTAASSMSLLASSGHSSGREVFEASLVTACTSIPTSPANELLGSVRAVSAASDDSSLVNVTLPLSARMLKDTTTHSSMVSSACDEEDEEDIDDESDDMTSALCDIARLHSILNAVDERYQSETTEGEVRLSEFGLSL